jgi:hypothetical protein
MTKNDSYIEYRRDDKFSIFGYQKTVQVYQRIERNIPRILLKIFIYTHQICIAELTHPFYDYNLMIFENL